MVPHMMKLAIDKLILAGTKDPFTVGLLVQDGHCDVMVLSLPYVAIYLPQMIGSFEIPENRVQLGLLLPGIGPLACVKDIATKTLDAIVHRPKEAPKELYPWTRTSYYFRSIQVPAPLAAAVGFDL
ncbi:hypothetical protein BGX27_004221 [Mortierella sp. AM989]|nr:hypothetical protein BGX27_004221 [Mortierella sp. AM989]